MDGKRRGATNLNDRLFAMWAARRDRPEAKLARDIMDRTGLNATQAWWRLKNLPQDQWFTPKPSRDEGAALAAAVDARRDEMRKRKRRRKI